MRVPVKTLAAFVEDVLAKTEVDLEQARYVTDNLIWCDLVGRTNHGVERLPILVKRVQKGLINSPCAFQLKSLSASMASLDGKNGFGHFVAAKAIDHATDIARDTGIGIVGVKNSNFFGAAGYYANRAAEKGMVSIVLSNSFPKVAAVGGVKAVLGTNPIAFGAPRENGRALIVDMSTASVAGSTIRQKLKSGEQLSEGVAVDPDGKPILDPSEIHKGVLLPAAGGKGFGLALMVEVLAGVLTGAGIAGQVNSMYKDFDNGGKNGQFLLAIDVEKWMPLDVYYSRLEVMAEMVLDPRNGRGTRLPGMARWDRFDENSQKGVLVEQPTVLELEKLAKQLGMTVPW